MKLCNLLKLVLLSQHLPDVSTDSRTGCPSNVLLAVLISLDAKRHLLASIVSGFSPLVGIQSRSAKPSVQLCVTQTSVCLITTFYFCLLPLTTDLNNITENNVECFQERELSGRGLVLVFERVLVCFPWWFSVFPADVEG